MSWFMKLVTGGSRGGAKIFIVLLIAILGSGIYAASKFGPVYMDKWDLEDYMEGQIRRLYSLGEDGIFEQVDNFVVEHNIPVRPYEDCEFEGELGEPGYMECNYMVTIYFPKYVHQMPVRAYKRVPKIPWTSN